MNQESNPWLSWLVEAPLNIFLIVVVTILLVFLLRWLVRRVVTRLSGVSTSRRWGRAQTAIGGQPQRTEQRLRTFQSVTNSTTGALLGTIATLMILSELGVDVRPLLASAGVAGVALAFGAQTLVRDIISGMFMLVEDQYGVGDRVELAAGFSYATGTVERVALRVTSVRDDDGRLWHVRNGEVLRVANASQGWSLAHVEVRVGPATDLSAAREAILETTTVVSADPALHGAITGEPTVLIEDISASAAVLRWSVRTTPESQWEVASAFRRELAKVFTTRGLDFAD